MNRQIDFRRFDSDAKWAGARFRAVTCRYFILEYSNW
jgi:hypothetical protein